MVGTRSASYTQDAERSLTCYTVRPPYLVHVSYKLVTCRYLQILWHLIQVFSDGNYVGYGGFVVIFAPPMSSKAQKEKGGGGGGGLGIMMIGSAL